MKNNLRVTTNPNGQSVLFKNMRVIMDVPAHVSDKDFMRFSMAYGYGCINVPDMYYSLFHKIHYIQRKKSVFEYKNKLQCQVNIVQYLGRYPYFLHEPSNDHGLQIIIGTQSTDDFKVKILVKDILPVEVFDLRKAK